MPKDSATSWSQQSWEYALQDHKTRTARIHLLEKQMPLPTGARAVLERSIACDREFLIRLETKYPQLKEIKYENLAG